jgi:hypothetical protein
MCKQQGVEGGTHVEEITKAGFDVTRRLKTREIVYEDERRDGDIRVRLVEVSLLLTFTSDPSADMVMTHCI